MLMTSGYIAERALSGIIIALMAGEPLHRDGTLTRWSGARNPFCGERPRTCWR